MIDDDDAMLTCPFNPSHTVRRARMQFHITKCMKAHEQSVGKSFFVCPLNANHRILGSAMSRHMMECESSFIVESVVCEIGVDQGTVNVPYQPPDLPPSEEDWDGDSTQSYNPVARNQNQAVRLTLMGATKSERKAFNQIQRKRIQRINDGLPAEDEETIQAEDALPYAELVQKTKPAFDYSQPLRAPKTRSKTYTGPPMVTQDVKPKENKEVPTGMGWGRGRVPPRVVHVTVEPEERLLSSEYPSLGSRAGHSRHRHH